MNKNYLFVLVSLLLLSCEQKPETNLNSFTSDSNSKNSNLDYENVVPKETEKEKKIREEEQETLRKEKETEELYGYNSLQTGSTPYSSNYGENSNCDDYGCSQINVTTSNSDVMVTIKKNDQVVRHAYIRAGDNYSFSFPNEPIKHFSITEKDGILKK